MTKRGMILGAVLALSLLATGAACGSGDDKPAAATGTTVARDDGSTKTTAAPTASAAGTIGKDVCPTLAPSDIEAATTFKATVNDRTEENGYMSYCHWDIAKADGTHAGHIQLQFFPKQSVPAEGGGKNDIHISNAVAITVAGAREAWADGSDWQKPDSYHCNADAVPASGNWYVLALFDSQAPVHPVDECQWAIKIFETAIKRLG